ncbi:hypothetical protein P0D88_04510 [Paraburkholderia sp. RL18-103-BIB-C]|jgi:hypothetical protein
MIDHLFGNARGVRLNGACRAKRGANGPLCCVSRLTGVSRRVPHH